MLDKFVVKLVEKWIPGLGHLLQKVAFLAIFLGFIGYFLNSLKEVDVSGIKFSPISNKAVEKIAPTPPQAR